MSKISEDCLECGICINECQFLSEIGEMPAEVAKRGAQTSEAYSCTLCGACEAVCPEGLSPKEMFAERRRQSVTDGEIDIDEIRYLLPDRKNNVVKTYRKHFGIDYSDIECKNECQTVFFPGCSLMTYAPKLTRETYRRLQESSGCGGVWIECCGKPLEQLGLKQRTENLQSRLKEFALTHKIKTIITACPNCYYEMKHVFKGLDINIRTVYEMISFSKQMPRQTKCTIHDSCPDRFDVVFGKKVRQALAACGYSIAEMPHNRKNTICCGSGGQISHFRPDLTKQLVEQRLLEADKSGADILVGYCLSCVLKFNGAKSRVSVAHALNLLLDVPREYTDAKKRAADMFSGTAGEKLWEKVMAD
jgi:Fe-S oxidoreductase